MQLKLTLMMLWVCCTTMVVAQKRYAIRYVPAEEKAAPGFLKKSVADKETAKLYLQQLPSQLIANGYWAASLDSVAYDSTEVNVWLFVGEKYAWQSIRFDSVAGSWLRRMGWSGEQKMKNFQALSPDSVQQSLLSFLANNGYPFASATWDSVQISEGKLDGMLRLQTGPSYKIDSVVQNGKSIFNRKFLYRHLQMQPGIPYSQQAIDDADELLDELLFAERVQPSSVQMLGSGSVMNVYMKPRRSNIFNVLIGVMPASTSTPDNKLLVTGDVNILLRNVFGGGETIGANWQQIQYKSPRLNLLYQQPFIFNSKAGFEFGFDLFKKDTQYLNLQLRVGVPYKFDRYQTGKVFYELQQNNLSYVDSNTIKLTKELPVVADFGISNLGVEWDFNNTDYRYNPRSGQQANLVAVGGLKKIRKNNTITSLKDPNNPAFDFNDLYDTVQLQTYQLRMKLQYAGYLPIGRQAVCKAGLQAAWLQSANYYRNELYQIGGYKILRGFDEESIFARNYAVLTAEYRYLTGRNGYLFAFADGGWAAYQDAVQRYDHTYFGTGLGLNFETKNSQVNLSWAVGKRNDLPMDFRQSKIHIGFVNFF
ncbi:MAG TPA: BamA/TamA family outer membrane protein [Phnomibacter sp.]|nr:BamA/TamA family outer membrane protein [Phnomibacter sp.]